jgi:glycogen(starch) synthase
MRIAYLSWESLHSIRVGGLAVVATRLCEKLSNRRHDVHLFTRSAHDQIDYEYIEGVHYHRLKFDPGDNTLHYANNMSNAMVSRLREVQRYHGKFEIVHGQDWHVVDALHELKNMGLPIVLTYHSTAYGRNGNEFGNWWEFREVSGKEWYGGYIANRVTTVSNSMKSELNWLYKVPPDKIDVIPNGVDPKRYELSIDQGMVKRHYGIHPFAPVVLFTGRMTPQKGPDLLVRAIPEVLKNRWDVKFIFAGEGEMHGYLQDLAKKLGVEHATKFLGFVTYWEFQQLIGACDIVCIPSRNEPFGIVLLEAWAAGRPVVATDVGGMRDNINNFENGVKVYTNPDSIAWGINYILNTPGAIAKLSAGGKAKVKEFTWAKAADKTLETYKNVLEK